MQYADKKPVGVSGQSWTSPVLYGPTPFKLIASAGQSGQTVSMSLTTTVQVANPEVVSFQALPEQIGVGALRALLIRLFIARFCIFKRIEQ
jgi:hypothetical protein